MTDEEVIQLYRALLGRDPENIDTIRAFQSYYPTLERGRRAIFTSDEFEAYFLRATGRVAHARDPVAAALAMLLLARAAGAAPPMAAAAAADADLRAGMGIFLGRGTTGRADPAFAVVVGQSASTALDDLLPLGHAQAAILHIAHGFPPVVPLLGTLDDGTPIFRLACDTASLAGILHRFARRLDALVLLDRPATVELADALRPFLAARALLAVGPAQTGFDAAALSATLGAAHPDEPVQRWRGLHLHHVGGWLLPVTYEPPRVAAPPVNRAAHPVLAVAAIVRDEAACVQNMLRSVLPVASFVAVLDTGSTDRTPALVESILAGSDIPFAVTIRHHASFGSDLSAMRNAAMAMVPAFCDWVLMLDADEALVPEDLGPLLALISAGTHDAYALPRYNFPGADQRGRMLSYPDRQVRLIRHRPDRPIGYSGAVHETVRGVAIGNPPLDESAVGGPRGGPHIHHLVRRFRTPAEEARKQAFYRDIAARSA